MAVGNCAGSNDGDLCVSTGRAGICYSSSCVVYSCPSYSAGYCQTDLGSLGTCNEYGNCEEIFGALGDDHMNPYYKILWAGLDVCDREEVGGEDKDDLVDNDECEGSRDYGFTYLATKTVTETNDSLMKPNLVFTPQEPQADHSKHSYSDYITVKANFNQDEVNDDFVYYDWDVYYCYEDEISDGTCTENINRRLTGTCYEDDVLGECSNGLESDSSAEGIGVREIKFRGTEDFYNDYQNSEKLYFKVFLKTKEEKASNSIGLSSVDIPVGKNDVGITLLDLTKNGNSYVAQEICTSGNYARICPVYSGQLLAIAHRVDSGASVDSFSWKVDNEKVVNKNNAINWSPLSSVYDSYIVVPVTKTGITLQTVSLNAKKDNGEEIVSERILSAAEPMTKIVSNDNSNLWYWIVDDGTTTGRTSENVMVGMIGEKVSLGADLVPDYLNGNLADNNISLKWYVNNEEVTNAFIAANSEQEIALSGQNIEFTLNGNEGDTINLAVEVIKDYSDEEKALLKENWGIQDFSTHSTKKGITIKQTSSSTTGLLGQNNSMMVFMASTLENAPEYFIFIIRTAIVFVLFWSLLYAFDYWSKGEFKLEKND